MSTADSSFGELSRDAKVGSTDGARRALWQTARSTDHRHDQIAWAESIRSGSDLDDLAQ
jgi:hypothetical protein